MSDAYHARTALTIPLRSTDPQPRRTASTPGVEAADHVRVMQKGSLAVVALVALVVSATGIGCGTMRGIKALRDVDFEVDRVNDVRVAGMRIDGRRGAEEVAPAETAMLAAAALSGHLPLECEVVVRASRKR